MANKRYKNETNKKLKISIFNKERVKQCYVLKKLQYLLIIVTGSDVAQLSDIATAILPRTPSRFETRDKIDFVGLSNSVCRVVTDTSDSEDDDFRLFLLIHCREICWNLINKIARIYNLRLYSMQNFDHFS